MQTLFNALNAHNIPVPNQCLDNGEFIRWGKNSRFWATRLGNDGWCFGDWSTGEKHCAFPDQNRSMTRAEWQQLHERLKAERIKLEQEQRERQEQVAETATALLAEGVRATKKSHPYLMLKKIKPFWNVVVNKRDLTLDIPLRDAKGKIWNLQRINWCGTKRFLAGGRLKGCFATIGIYELSNEFIVCEGYATGASIYKAFLMPVIVAMSAGNLEPVVQEILRVRPDVRLIIAADNDWEKPTNTGRDTAIAVGRKYGLKVIVPKFSERDTGLSDFNDLHTRYGLTAVKKQLTKGFQNARN